MKLTHSLFNQTPYLRRFVDTKPLTTLTLVIAMATATAASAGVTFTGLERSVSAGGNTDSSSDLFTHYDIDLSYTEDTGGIFIPATSRAQQNSLLDLATETLAFSGLARARGGAASGGNASNTLFLNFTVDAGMTTDLMLVGSIFGSDGGGIDPGSSGGIGTATIRLLFNGALIYNNFSGTDGTVSVNDLLVLDSGSYELSIMINANGPPQTGTGLGSADLDIGFVVPAPSAVTIALVCGVFSTRRRR